MGSNADRREDQERRYVLVSVKAETWGRNMSARYLQDGFDSILPIEDLNARSRSAAVGTPYQGSGCDLRLHPSVDDSGRVPRYGHAPLHSTAQTATAKNRQCGE